MDFRVDHNYRVMQIFSDAIVEEQKKHTNNQRSNNNSIPVDVKTEPENVVQPNIIKHHTFTNAVPKPAATAPLFSTPENRSVNSTYPNGSVKNGRKRVIKDQVIVLENINLDSISQSTSSDNKLLPKKSTYRRQYIKSADKQSFKKSPLHVSVNRAPPTNVTTASDPFSIDSCFSQECSSTHSDDNSILSPVEATECVMRTMGFASDGNDTWQSWDTSESKSPRPDLTDKSVDEKPVVGETSQENTSFSGVEASSTQHSAIDPSEITLNDPEVENKKTHKPSATKDPESGLTIDTVKRRKLCSRYDNLLANHGISHRLDEVPHLTNIQVAGLLRRSRNRPEMADVSEAVWNFVFEERRRVEDRSFTDNIITSKEFNKKLNSMKAEDGDEATDCSDNEDYGSESGFPFEEVQNLEDEDNNVHEILRSECKFYEDSRYFHETDRWLCLLKRSLVERNARAKQIGEQVTKKPNLQFTTPTFDENEDSTEHCARCMPVNVLNRPKIVKQALDNFDRKTESFNFIKHSESFSTLDDDLSRCLEELSLQIREEDFSVLDNLRHPIIPEPRLIIENMSELRRREARERAKKASEHLKKTIATQRSVGRPPKNRQSASKNSSDAHRKQLKRKASRDHRERLNSNEINIIHENPSELRSFEEQLRRLSKDYKYSEITVPKYRPFELEGYMGKEAEKLARKISTEPVDDQLDMAGPSNESQQLPYDSMFYARIHHKIEFPKLSEELIKKRRKEKWMIPIAEHVPFAPEMYEHEDPRDITLMYCMKNEKEQPFAARFHPGIMTQPCQHIHREPKMISLNKLYRQHKAPTPNSNIS